MNNDNIEWSGISFEINLHRNLRPILSTTIAMMMMASMMLTTKLMMVTTTLIILTVFMIEWFCVNFKINLLCDLKFCMIPTCDDDENDNDREMILTWVVQTAHTYIVRCMNAQLMRGSFPTNNQPSKQWMGRLILRVGYKSVLSEITIFVFKAYLAKRL